MVIWSKVVYRSSTRPNYKESLILTLKSWLGKQNNESSPKGRRKQDKINKIQKSKRNEIALKRRARKSNIRKRLREGARSFLVVWSHIACA